MQCIKGKLIFMAIDFWVFFFYQCVKKNRNFNFHAMNHMCPEDPVCVKILIFNSIFNVNAFFEECIHKQGIGIDRTM